MFRQCGAASGTRKGKAITGRLLNTSTRALSVEVGNGSNPARSVTLDPAEEREVRLGGVGEGSALAELWVREEGQVSSRWVFPVERSGEAHYLAHNQDVWSQKMGVVTS